MIKIFMIIFLALYSNKSGAEIAGSSPRQEVENKTSFLLPENVSISKLKKDILKALPEVVNKKTKLNKFLNNQYTLSHPDFTQFVFLDYYFDTKDYRLIKYKSAYRLRYRWKNLGLYTRHQYFPFVSNFYPIRVEIQFKEGYKVNEDGLMETFESRFEFRKESFPFTRKNVKVPKKPWEYEDFYGYLKTGYFKKFRMMPSYRFETKTGLVLKDIELQKVFKVETVRNRIHLNINNPWGTGPNVSQAFIISIDQSVSSKNGKQYSFVEIEIEPDRNTSRELNQRHQGGGGVRASAIHKFTNDAKEAYFHDLKIVRDTIYKVLEENKIKKLPLKYKYYRFYEELIEGREK